MQFRTLRTTTAAVAAVLALGVGAPANAATPTQATISLTTYAYVDANDTLHIEAHGEFVGGIVSNSTVTMQIAGTETWTDSVSGRPGARPLFGAPISARFDDVNVVRWSVRLVQNSTFDVSYHATVSGLAPTVFAGQCAGTTARINGGAVVVVKTC